MKFVIITKIPKRQGFLGPLPEKNVVEEVEAVSLDTVTERLHIPTDGECWVVKAEHITIVKPRIINEVIS